MRYTEIFTSAVLVGVASAALAHGGATGIVKERMDAMSAMGKAVKQVAPMMSGETAYDADTVRHAAETIGKHAGDTMTRLFPEGSGGMPSVAKDAIWQDWESFARLAEELHTYSEGLALAADNSTATQPGAMPSAGAMMGETDMMGADTMMGGGGMKADNAMSREELAEMPVVAVFAMVSNTCSSCHSRFRAEAK
ncbi:cytochrome c [Aliiroseovarius sp. F47248L]|uniref:c-type cytochrome n=1 Tax=Aliiroseovarius sp. F47248L TaxID=2926420 RepID=UPI001FF4A848|nr:cytochrome c [Aliiroseovarius sp. F47248L]MCK0137929.1 cytochrome c [Aliiroseovarius sp. F47248L]